ncbi:MAG: hypothetical protein Q8M95_06935 [Candidatus Methanoperedens sp.]|nr:hypothetical protein [Candidatus Methanoperedens sp.]
MFQNIDVQTRGLIKTISSNLIRAQKEENKDLTNRNRYLEKAGFDSVRLAHHLFEQRNNTESSRYLLSAAHSYESAEAFNQARACYDKIIEIEEQDFIDKAKEGITQLSDIIKCKKEKIDYTTREGKISFLDFLVWKHRSIKTTQAMELFKSEFDEEVGAGSIRSYAHELQERRRVIIWGGPQGREYHIYPNIADLATRERYYGVDTLVAGSIESRITSKFKINFENWYFNKELFQFNEIVVPKMVIAVDMEAFVQNIVKFAAPSFSVKAFGTLENF